MALIGANGGLIGSQRSTTTAIAVGLWTSNEQVLLRRANAWPALLPSIGDSYQGGFCAGFISTTANSAATHVLVVAPRATGATGTGYTLTTMLAWKTTGTTTAGTTSEFDGATNSANMNNASHPAAQFCEGLSIGGYSDWYLPARYELEIAYFNLKPTTADNSTSSGINPYSVPERTANYTTSAPPQTSLAAFKGGGAEAFVNDNHWTSTEASSTNAWRNDLFNGAHSSGSSKTSTFRVRAFRRVAL